MNNYEYIIASLPVPEAGAGIPDTGSVLDFIRSQCSEKDAALVDIICRAFDPDRLDSAFYAGALACRNAFVREFLRYDMLLRNTKVEYLNRVLGRPEGLDIMVLPGGDADEASAPEFDEKPAVLAVLLQDDILARERGIDRLLWDKADELTRMHLFDMDIILAVVAKLLITERWNKLDPATGRELFRNLVQEIRHTR